MAATKMEPAEPLRKARGADADWLRGGVRVLAQALTDAEVSAQTGAEHGQRTPDRLTHRNGYRPREWDARVGTVELAILRLRQGSYLPSWLEPRRRAGRAPCAVVAQCCVEGVSTRRVDEHRPPGGHRPGPPSRRSAGSAPSSTRWTPPGATGPWTPAVPVCVGRRPEHARARGGGGSARPPCWSPPASTMTGSRGSSGWTSARPRTAHRGRRSCAAWSPAPQSIRSRSGALGDRACLPWSTTRSTFCLALPAPTLTAGLLTCAALPARRWLSRRPQATDLAVELQARR